MQANKLMFAELLQKRHFRFFSVNAPFIEHAYIPYAVSIFAWDVYPIHTTQI